MLRLVKALASVHARPRGTAEDSSFRWDVARLDGGLSVSLMTDIGPIDLRGEVSGIGSYEEAFEGANWFELFGHNFAVLEICKLILAKRTAGRAKDQIVLAELEAIRDRQLRDSR